jgi:hypothetical protein
VNKKDWIVTVIFRFMAVIFRFMALIFRFMTFKYCFMAVIFWFMVVIFRFMAVIFRVLAGYIQVHGSGHYVCLSIRVQHVLSGTLTPLGPIYDIGPRKVHALPGWRCRRAAWQT